MGFLFGTLVREKFKSFLVLKSRNCSYLAHKILWLLWCLWPFPLVLACWQFILYNLKSSLIRWFIVMIELNSSANSHVNKTYTVLIISMQDWYDWIIDRPWTAGLIRLRTKKSAFVSFSVSLKIGSFSSWLDKNPSSRSNCHWRKYLDNAVKDYVTASIWKTTKWCRMYLDHCLAVGRMEISLKVPKKKILRSC
jgi:hypothetical protein